jgi:hypothetical protein
MRKRILRTTLAIIVIVSAGAVSPRAPHHLPTDAAGAGIADIVLAETSAANPPLLAIAQHPAANQLNVIGHTFSEPLLLLLMGSLLIGVGSSIRRLTRSRRGTRAAVPRQT